MAAEPITETFAVVKARSETFFATGDNLCKTTPEIAPNLTILFLNFVSTDFFVNIPASILIVDVSTTKTDTKIEIVKKVENNLFIFETLIPKSTMLNLQIKLILKFIQTKFCFIQTKL